MVILTSLSMHSVWELHGIYTDKHLRRPRLGRFVSDEGSAAVSHMQSQWPYKLGLFFIPQALKILILKINNFFQIRK